MNPDAGEPAPVTSTLTPEDIVFYAERDIRSARQYVDDLRLLYEQNGSKWIMTTIRLWARGLRGSRVLEGVLRRFFEMVAMHKAPFVCRLAELVILEEQKYECGRRSVCLGASSRNGTEGAVAMSDDNDVRSATPLQPGCDASTTPHDQPTTKKRKSRSLPKLPCPYGDCKRKLASYAYLQKHLRSYHAVPSEQAEEVYIVTLNRYRRTLAVTNCSNVGSQLALAPEAPICSALYSDDFFRDIDFAVDDMRVNGTHPPQNAWSSYPAGPSQPPHSALPPPPLGYWDHQNDTFVPYVAQIAAQRSFHGAEHCKQSPHFP